MDRKLHGRINRNEVDGLYVSFGIEKTFQLIEPLNLTTCVSTGWANKGYNRYYFGLSEAEWNDGLLSLDLEYAFSEGITLAAKISWSWLWREDLRRTADQLYLSNSALFGGMGMTMAF